MEIYLREVVQEINLDSLRDNLHSHNYRRRLEDIDSAIDVFKYVQNALEEMKEQTELSIAC